MKNNLKCLGLLCLLVAVIIFGAFYSIDLKNMDEGKPVFFSTWGRKYSPVEDEDALAIRSVINNYIVSTQEENAKHINEKWFCADKIYLISKSEDIYTAYAWIYAASYVKKSGGELLEGNGFSVPYVFTISSDGVEFTVDKAEFPSDGTYAEDLENLFPPKVLNNINKAQTDGTIESLQMDIQNQIAEFHN